MAWETIREQKIALRHRMRGVLRLITPEEREAASQRLRMYLHELPLFQESRVVLIFASMSTEPDIMPLLEAYGHEKKFCFPRMTPTGLGLYAAKSDQELVMVGKVREPVADEDTAVSYDQVNFALIPGLAYAANLGIRLGRGGGYFDRLLASQKFQAFTLGICFHQQIMLKVPHEAHDCPVRCVLTDRGVV